MKPDIEKVEEACSDFDFDFGFELDFGSIDQPEVQLDFVACTSIVAVVT